MTQSNFGEASFPVRPVAPTETAFRTALIDLMASLKQVPLAFYMAWSDTRARYRRSVLGPLWIVLGTAIGVAGLGYLWSAILGMDQKVLIPSITVGLVVWQLLAATIIESPMNFVRAGQVIRNIQTPYLIFPIQALLRQLITFAHNCIVIAIVMLIYVTNWSWVQLLFFPGLALVAVNLLWVSVVLATLGARFRDLEPLLGAVMPMLFFLSPVIYRPESLPLQSWIIWSNPLAYFIAAIRDPLQGIVPDSLVYVGLSAMAVIGWAIALRLLGHRHSRIAFWV